MTTNQNSAQLVDALVPAELKERLIADYKAKRLSPNTALKVLRNENVNITGAIDRYDVADWLRNAAAQAPATKTSRSTKKKEASS